MKVISKKDIILQVKINFIMVALQLTNGEETASQISYKHIEVGSSPK
jgi:hypothetical protein